MIRGKKLSLRFIFFADLTSKESSAFTIQQSVQVDAIKNPVEKKAKKQPAYWRKNFMPAGDQHIQQGEKNSAQLFSYSWSRGQSVPGHSCARPVAMNSTNVSLLQVPSVSDGQRSSTHLQRGRRRVKVPTGAAAANPPSTVKALFMPG